MELQKAHSESLLPKIAGDVTAESSFFDSLRTCCFIPRRYIFAILGAAGFFNALALRLCLNIAITQMIKQRKTEEMKFDPDACPRDIFATFDWNEETQGLILSGFYYGYLLIQVPGAYFAEKYGGKWVIGLGLLCTSLFTFLTPWVIRAGGATGLFILRVLEGITEVGHDWGFYTMISDLPKYSYDVLKFNVASTGILTGLPYAAMSLFAFVFGVTCDFGIKKKWHSIKTARIIYISIGAVGPAIFIILASYCGCNRSAAMIYFITSMGLMGAFYSGLKVNLLDIAPNYAGSLTSFVNTTSTVGGMIMPYLIGLLTPDSTLTQWRTAFWVCFVVLTSTNVVYCVWIDGKQQWWDDVRKYGYPSDWKYGNIHHDVDVEKSKEYETNFVETEKIVDK